MSSDTDILIRAEEVLNTGRSPDEVCADAPELSYAVRERVDRARRLDAHVEELFPTPGPAARDGSAKRAAISTKLPAIPGYVVERVLGQGGMGIVYRATHVRLKRPVAIKMMLIGAYASAHDRERFMREAEAIAALQHPNIVQVHDVGEFDDRLYFSMEVVEGQSLGQQLAGTPMPARDAAMLLVKLADAVQSAHDHGVIHRDLKPGNVLMAADGTPKITDFGLARRMNGDAALTLTGVRMGTPSYMAPEQVASGDHSIGPAVDVYALGAVLYELLTGRPPFRAETASETERQLMTQEPAPPSRLNARVPRDPETICLKCLQKDPQRRYATARELADDLHRFLNHQPILARPISRAERGIRWMQRHPKETALIVVALLLIVVALVAGMREWKHIVVQRAEMAKWVDRLAFIIQLQEEGRFTEARTILARIPDGGSDEIRGQIERAEADLDIVERLDTIRLTRGQFKQGGGFDYEKAAHEYQVAFEEIGMGTLYDDPATVAARIRQSPIRDFLVAALDDCATCANAEARGWILDVVKQVDPDPWRDRVRDQKNWAGTDILAELAEIVEVERQPVNLLVAMGTRWRRLGGDPTEFLLKVHRQYPNDFWVNFELGHLFGAVDQQIAIGFNRAAVALRPNASAPHFNLGVSFRTLKRFEDALHHFEQAVIVDPDHTWALLGLGFELLRAERFEEAIEPYDRAFALDRADVIIRDGWVWVHMRSGRGSELQAKWANVLSGRPADHNTWDGYAELCLYLGDVDAYHRACDGLLDQFGGSTDPFICERTGRAVLLLPTADEQLRKAQQLINRARRAELNESDAWVMKFIQLAAALAHYRAHEFDAAVDLTQGDVLTALPPAGQLVRAMALHQRGDTEAARAALDQAVGMFDWGSERATDREAWIFHILRREAEALIRRVRAVHPSDFWANMALGDTLDDRLSPGDHRAGSRAGGSG